MNPIKVMGTIYNLDYQRIREVERLGLRNFELVGHHSMVRKPVYEFLYNYVDFNEERLTAINYYPEYKGIKY